MSTKSRKNQWKPWIKIVNSRRVTETLSVTFPEYKHLIAAALAVAKWHPSRGKKQGMGNCSYCVQYRILNVNNACENCPLDMVDQNCFDTGSYFSNIGMEHAASKRAENRMKLYDLLMDFYREEYKEVMGK